MRDSMICLAEWPVLARLAARRSDATRLDARACKFVYEAELKSADLPHIDPRETLLIEELGVKLPRPDQGVA